MAHLAPVRLPEILVLTFDDFCVLGAGPRLVLHALQSSGRWRGERVLQRLRPVRPESFRVLASAACALNATGPHRVSLSLPQEHF